MSRLRIPRALLCALLLLFTQAGFAAEEAPATRYVRGRITGVDAPGNKISIEWLYGAFDPARKILTFSYLDDVEVLSDRRPIFERVRPIGIVDLIVSDHVVIRYYEDRARNRLVATRIRVLSHDIPRAP